MAKHKPDILDDAFLRKEYTFKGRVLRPMTLGSFALLRKVKNQFVTNEPVNGAEFDIAAFFFLHEMPLPKVCALALDPDAFFAAVVEYAEEITLEDVKVGAELVGRMVADATAGKVINKTKEGEAPKD